MKKPAATGALCGTSVRPLPTCPAALVRRVPHFVSTYLCFRLAHMLLLKEKLAVQITDVNGVQVNLKNHKSKVKTN